MSAIRHSFGTRLAVLLAAVLVLSLLLPVEPSAARDPYPGVAPGGQFGDDDRSVHEPWIQALWDRGVTSGCDESDETRYCPNGAVTRAQMASFLARALALSDAPNDAFDDDHGSVHEWAINAVAHAGIAFGCDTDRFCPSEPVTRAQAASFLVRAFGSAWTPADDPFADDDGSVHEDAIERLSGAGITSGCGPGAYCPHDSLTRGQMATLLGRAAGFEAMFVPLDLTGALLIATDDGIVALTPWGTTDRWLGGTDVRLAVYDGETGAVVFQRSGDDQRIENFWPGGPGPEPLIEAAGGLMLLETGGWQNPGVFYSLDSRPDGAPVGDVYEVTLARRLWDGSVDEMSIEQCSAPGVVECHERPDRASSGDGYLLTYSTSDTGSSHTRWSSDPQKGVLASVGGDPDASAGINGVLTADRRRGVGLV